MRTNWQVIGLLIAVLALGLIFTRSRVEVVTSASAAPEPEAKKDPPVLHTSGSATVRLAPDAARVFFGVQTQGKTVKEARQENNQRVRQIMAALAELKIPDLKSRTADVQVEILYARDDETRPPSIRGYRVTTSFTVLISDKDRANLGVQASRVLDAALEAGANSVQRIAFLNSSGMVEARRKALTQAVEDALANAQALVRGAGKERIEAFNIQGTPIYREPYFGGNRGMQTANVAMPVGADEGSVVVGDLEVTCQVSIICHF